MENQLIQKMFEEQIINEVSENEFTNQNMQVLIFTENGKPVFTTYNNEYDVSSKIATLTIILNKLEISWNDNDKPLFFENEKKIHTFKKKYNLWFLIICLEKKELIFLQKLLDLMCDKLISQISAHFQQILEKKSNFDLLSNVNIDKQSIVQFQLNIQKFIPVFFDTCFCFPLKLNFRNQFRYILSQIKHENLLLINKMYNNGI